MLNNGNSDLGSFHQGLHLFTYQPFLAQIGISAGVQVNADIRSSVPTEFATTNAVTITTPQPRNAQATVEGHAEQPQNWDALPVNNATFVGAGSKGFQSDAAKMNVLFEQSDATEDRVFGASVTVTVNQTTGTPTHALVVADELDDVDAIQSHSNFEIIAAGGGVTNNVSRNSFVNIDQTVTLGTTHIGVDGGAAGNLNVAAGGMLVIYSKITDNTNTDGDDGDGEIRFAAFDDTFTEGGTIGNGSNENATLIGANTGNASLGAAEQLDAQKSDNTDVVNMGIGSAVVGVITVPNNVDIANEPAFPNATNSDTAAYVYITDRETTRTDNAGVIALFGNNSGQQTIFTRKFELGGTTTVNAPTAQQRFVPTAPASAAGGDLPTRIDHEQGSADDVTGFVDDGVDGESVGFVFEQGDQLFFNSTTDGVSYETLQGFSNPLLVTNDDSEDVIKRTVSFCTDGSGNVQDSVIVFSKNDKGGNGNVGSERARVRTGDLIN